MVAGAKRWANAAATTLNGAITNVATTVTVTDASSFPATGEFTIRVESEFMLVTSRATNVLTVTRGAEGSTAAAHADTVAVNHVVSGADLDELYLPTDRALFNPAAMMFMHDDFAATSGNAFGALGWRQIAGTASVLDSEVGHPGIGRISTGIVANDSARTTIRAANQNSMHPSDNFDAVFIVRPNTVDTDSNVELGFVDDAGYGTLGEVPNFIGISKGWGQTTWQYTVRKANTSTTDNSAITATAAWHRFRIRRKGSLIYFSVDGGAETAISAATNIPIVPLGPAVAMRTQTTVSKTIDIDYFHLLVTGLTR